MKNTNASEKHINNNLKIIMSFANALEQNTDFENVKRSHIISFLDSKIKSPEEDPHKKWITIWNVYLNHLKYFFRWLYNEYNNKDRYANIESEYISQANWVTPDFVNIVIFYELQQIYFYSLSNFYIIKVWIFENKLGINKMERTF